MKEADKNNIPRENVTRINGKGIITNWKEIRVSTPENLQNKLGGVKDTSKAIRQQKDIKAPTSNLASS
jgi:hypothetical protein